MHRFERGVVIMARMSLMDYQMHCRMQEIFCPNESRHQAKQEFIVIRPMLPINKPVSNSQNI